MFEMIPEDAVYFPADTFGTERTAVCFSRFLRAMGEPPLRERSAEGLSIVRFLWLRTFHHPICVRAEGPLPAKLVVTRTLGMGGYDPGAVDQKWAKPLSAGEWNDLAKCTSDPEVWGVHQRDPWGIDGAPWILEASLDREYRIAAHWCPRESGPATAFRRACWSLIMLAGEDLIDGDVY